MSGRERKPVIRRGTCRAAQASSSAFSKPGSGGVGAVTPRGTSAETQDESALLARGGGWDGDYVIYLNNDIIGGRDASHGRSLLRDFLFTLTEIAPPPYAIVLVNSAVCLAFPGSDALESLSLMHEQGVRILVAERSIEENAARGEIAVGKAATMHAILHTLLTAQKVVSP